MHCSEKHDKIYLTQHLNHPFVHSTHAMDNAHHLSHLEAILFIRLTSVVSHCLHKFLLDNAGIFDKLKRSHKALPLGEKMKLYASHFHIDVTTIQTQPS